MSPSCRAASRLVCLGYERRTAPPPGGRRHQSKTAHGSATGWLAARQPTASPAVRRQSPAFLLLHSSYFRPNTHTALRRVRRSPSSSPSSIPSAGPYRQASRIMRSTQNLPWAGLPRSQPPPPPRAAASLIASLYCASSPSPAHSSYLPLAPLWTRLCAAFRSGGRWRLSHRPRLLTLILAVIPARAESIIVVIYQLNFPRDTPRVP
jgi:hypothetical protein